MRGATRRRAKSRKSRYHLVQNLLAAILVILVVVTFIVWLSRFNRSSVNQPKSMHSSLSVTQPLTFDFYSLLPKMKVGSLAHSSSLVPSKAQVKPAYFLQTKFFSHLDQINVITARLVLLGLNSSVQKNRGKVRVMIGPFVSQSDAKKVKNQLAHYKIYADVHTE